MAALSRRDFLKLSAAGVATAAAGAAGWGVWGAYRFERTLRRAPLTGLTRPLSVVQLTDLHVGPYIGLGQAEAWVAAAMAEPADLVLLTGDVVDHRYDGSLPALSEVLAGLSAPLGVYSVWGNHDYMRFRNRADPSDRAIAPLRAALDAAGIRTLQNESVRVRDDLTLVGMDDFTHGLPRFERALRDVDPATATLLLSHNPDALPRVPEWVGLTLCGHTHGGQIRLPGVGALVTSSMYGQRFAQGWVEGPARGYVSRGLGVSLLPLRVDCPAELTAFELVPA